MSDSDSDYDEGDYSSGLTSVLLAFADDKPVSTDTKLGALENHLGGLPIWLNSRSSPDPDLTKCKCCGTQLPLLAQISAPLPDTYYDRALYVFGCKNPECRRKEGSIRALRSIKRDAKAEAQLKAQEEAEREKESSKSKSSVISGNVFEVSGEGSSSSETSSNPFSSQADPFAVSSSSTFKQEPTDSKQSTHKPADKAAKKEKSSVGAEASVVEDVVDRFAFPCFLLDVESEVLSTVKFDASKVEIDNSETNESSSSESAIKTAELNSNVDPSFLKFIQVVESNPEQVLRYDMPLQPLFYSSENALGSLPSDKLLELQLMPHAISVLESLEEDILAGMEWGTIFVATSKDDTNLHLDNNGIGYQEEWVAVQWEEEIEDEKKQ